MGVSVEASELWEGVLELTKTAQDKKSDALLWAVQLSASLSAAGVGLPSVELAHLMVSHICFGNHVPIAWKFLEKALALKIAPPMLVLSLLSIRVIPNRQNQPGAYRIYMELLKRHAFSFAPPILGPNYQKIMKSIDDVLHLSQIYGLQVCEPGVLLVEFVFSVVWQLLDASLDDEGLLELTPEKKSRWPTRSQDMDIDGHDSFSEKRADHNEGLQKVNTAMAVEIIGEFLQNKVTSRILYLARRNMPSHWGVFIQRMQLLAAKSAVLRNSKHISPETLLQLTSDTREVLSRECKTMSGKEFHAVMASGSLISSANQLHGIGCSALWLPIDLFLEDAMDGSQVAATNAVEILTGLVQALQAVNATTWHDTFLGLWIAALRLVQRERDICEGPVPRLDTCMCMLLSITTLTVANFIEEEESELIDETEHIPTNQSKEKEVQGKRRKDLVTSLQLLGDYEGLLTAPQAVSLIANQAAAKAIMFISGLPVSSGYYECVSINDMPMNFSGNMWHLIVEACIARNLLDTSAYLWPGYVNVARSNQVPRSVPGQALGWSSLMKGSPLTPSLINALVATPASSLAELEKIYEIAVNGSDDEKISAATVLCGASLVRGWSIQEHTILFIMRLLLPPVPADYSGSDSHLISCAPFLNVLLVGISAVDCVQIFSLHGLVPLLAGALMPICEVFGSCIPNVSWALTTGEELSCHAVFCNAFTLLLKLWRFDQPPVEHVMGDAPPIASQLSPEYLLLVRNSQLSSFGRLPKDQMKSRRLSRFLSFSREPIFIDSFPNLKLWYRQHQECMASILSGLVPGTPVHQIVDTLLDMMFRKINRGGQPLTQTSGTTNSSGSGALDSSVRLKVPAWDILEATPFVLDAALTACAHGRLSPRELATGGSSPATLPLPLAALVSLTITYKFDKATERFLGMIGPALNSLASSCPWPCMPIVASLWALKIKRWSDFFVFSASHTVFHHNSDAVVQLLKTCFTSTLGLCSSHIYSNGGVGALLGHGIGSHFSAGITPVAPGILYLRVHRSIRDVMFMTEEIVSLLMHSVRDIASNGLPKDKVAKLKKAKYGLRYGQVSLAAAMMRVKLAASLGASLVWISGGSGLVQSLIRETLPSWFLSVHVLGQEVEESGSMISMLGGYALAYFVLLCGTFAWGVDSTSTASKRRPRILEAHLEFLARALDGKISLGCDCATWQAYVSGFVSLLVGCTPMWVLEVDVDVLKRLSKGLRQWNEEELALALLGLGGVGAMGAAAELIIEREF
ncbi:mediator of RNA polymerase II transcription subunit 33B-like isoform X2 [Corylus avellana]|uniref:mediator of RNA polymerase II transcription subunit 33B-like isoform X2 n=1 Tax=Corylus avellana TaxID=13451 RepID=UPI00286A2F57|nr:mediator of RNA polymerase II transcription subunit 33B-like isoform X2 [Corylus avellana]